MLHNDEDSLLPSGFSQDKQFLFFDEEGLGRLGFVVFTNFSSSCMVPQCLHKLAAAFIDSAHATHSFVSGMPQ
jgi:hypothetical protein